MIIVDESRDSSTKEQMALVIRWVANDEFVQESFLDIDHVTSTAAIDLRNAIIDLLL
jgi:hypothetical protein